MKNTRIDNPRERLVYGINPVLETLMHGGGQIKEIIVASGRKGGAVENIYKLASAKGIPLSWREKSYLDKVAEGGGHQGVAAVCESFNYAHIDEMAGGQAGKSSIILVLDSIADPRNLGAIIRTAHCLGVEGIVIATDRSVPVTPTVMKVSAGAASWIPIARVVNLSRTIEDLKKKGFWVYGADAGGGRDIAGFDDRGSVVLVLGSEDRGLRPLIKKQCDFLVSIPMLGSLDSLNVSVAAGIILYEMTKNQRKEK